MIEFFTVAGVIATAYRITRALVYLDTGRKWQGGKKCLGHRPTMKLKTNSRTERSATMKTAGYWECRNEIIAARLPTPHKYEPFTELFNVDKLDAIRDKYGIDLYRECYADAAHEVMEAANVTTHLCALGVECKPIFTPDDCHVNYIAVFSLGNTTAQRINDIARKADLCVLFQCPTH